MDEELRHRLATPLEDAVDNGQGGSVRTSHCCGSARQLPGGGWLVSWGDNPLVTGFDAEGRLAFRLRLAASSFRAVPVPPSAAGLTELDRGMEAMERGGR